VIDLHLHTTASDGRLAPGELVRWAAVAGVTVMAVTDHDTTSAIAEVRTAAAKHGIEAVSGIEITAVEGGRDIHMLGYFFDVGDAGLAAFLADQRKARVDRAEAIAATLASLGKPIDLRPMLSAVKKHTGRSIGRPQVAQAMITAGHVANLREAFDDWLGEGRPAFMPRQGPTPEEVLAVVHAAGGIVSLAHPGRTRIDGRIPSLVEAGLDSLEVYHPDHKGEGEARYRALATSLECLMTGGSDFHGDTIHGLTPGSTSLPREDWERLETAVRRHA
jgi:predicted metal-dependent phosphoesterase TrpH